MKKKDKANLGKFLLTQIFHPKEILRKILINILWKISDDADCGIDSMEEFYEGVPNSLKKCSVETYVFYDFYKVEEKKKCLKWVKG